MPKSVTLLLVMGPCPVLDCANAALTNKKLAASVSFTRIFVSLIPRGDAPTSGEIVLEDLGDDPPLAPVEIVDVLLGVAQRFGIQIRESPDDRGG
jgi:hypothetical protein